MVEMNWMHFFKKDGGRESTAKIVTMVTVQTNLIIIGNISNFYDFMFFQDGRLFILSKVRCEHIISFLADFSCLCLSCSL